MNDGETAIEFDTVLVPVDGGEESTAAVDYAVAVADRYDATVHVLYVLGRGVVTGIDAGAVDEDDVAENARRFLEDASAVADDHDVAVATSMTQGFSTQEKSRHPGTVVLDAADAVGADFLVVPRESVFEPPAEVLEQVAEYVLSYASQPVLSV